MEDKTANQRITYVRLPDSHERTLDVYRDVIFQHQKCDYKQSLQHESWEAVAQSVAVKLQPLTVIQETIRCPIRGRLKDTFIDTSIIYILNFYRLVDNVFVMNNEVITPLPDVTVKASYKLNART